MEMIGLAILQGMPDISDTKVLLYIALALAAVVLGVLTKRAGLLLDKLIDSPSRTDWDILVRKVDNVTSLLERRIAGDDPWKNSIERRVSSLEDAA